MKKHFLLLISCALFSLSLAAQENYVSKVWTSDNGKGSYKNPVLYTDYSDPDVCRVGDDYYMTASSFNCIPGLPILHSKDLINWELIGHAVTTAQPPLDVYSVPRHGDGIWAPAIRHHNDTFYIFYGDPDYGIYMTKSAKAEGPWSPLVLVKEGKGLIDPCPLWDDNGDVYLAFAYAGSRAGIKSLLLVCRLSADASTAISEEKIVYDGHEIDETVEGAKFYKRNGYYYIFAPAGGVTEGWQLALRSKNPFGPYERKMVLAQGKTSINGPHQGAWVDTKTGEDWFFHFQEQPAYGRVLHLQPMKWANDWPVMGEDKDGDGCGEPVLTYKKPNVGANFPIATPVESDEFDGEKIGLQWQWHANPRAWWAYINRDKKQLRMFSAPLPEGAKTLWSAGNLLMQKFPAPEFTVNTKLKFTPSKRVEGERAGLVVMGFSYANLAIEKSADGFVLSQNECIDANNKNSVEKQNATVKLPSNEVYLRVKVEKNALCTFSYSLDGKKFETLGSKYTAKSGRWIGAKAGFFCTRPKASNDGGWIDVDYFRVEK